jgi:predicted phosphodiesterase
LLRAYEPLAAPVAVYCHIHVPFVRRLARMIVANTGSVSQSYDGDRRASYLLIDADAVTNRRVEYDVESEARDVINSGLPHAEWMARILLAGKYVPAE